MACTSIQQQVWQLDISFRSVLLKKKVEGGGEPKMVKNMFVGSFCIICNKQTLNTKDHWPSVNICVHILYVEYQKDHTTQQFVLFLLFDTSLLQANQIIA